MSHHMYFSVQGKMYGEAWNAHCAPMRGFMNQATSIRYNIYLYACMCVIKIRYENVLPCLIFISIQVSRVTIGLERRFHHLL